MNKLKSFLAVLTLLIVYSFFYVGMWLVDENTVIESEGRKVTKFHRLSSLKKKDIRKFFVEMDNYIADRILFKDALFRLISPIYKTYFLEMNFDKAIKGNDGWYFLGNSYENIVDKHTKDLPLSKDAIGRINDFLELNKFTKSMGIDFAVVICPDKHSIYWEYFPVYLKSEEKNKRYIDKIIPVLKEKNIFVIDLYSAVMEKKNEGYLYHKSDTHWNILGAEAGFKEIYKNFEIKLLDKNLKKYNDLPKYEIKKASSISGDLIRIGGFYNTGFENNDNYQLTYLNDYVVKWIVKNGEEIKKISKPRWIANPKETTPISPLAMRNEYAANNLKLVVIGDSFFTSLVPFFNASFSEIIYINDYFSMKEKIALIKKVKPDMVIWEKVERRV